MQFLLKGPPWIRYRTRLDLLSEEESHPEVLSDRQAMMDHPLVTKLTAELKSWPGAVLFSHKSAGHPIHKLTFLAEKEILARMLHGSCLNYWLCCRHGAMAASATSVPNRC